MARLRAHRGCGRGGPGGPCENHTGVDATYRVGVIGSPVAELWLLCETCTKEITKNVAGVIAAPIRGAVR